jgi:hypothetical protein
MATIKITKDGVSNEIIADLAWAQATYPDHTCEDVTYVPTDAEIAAEKEQEARQWRDSELARTDSLSVLTDHPQKTEIAAYRTALRDWPSTDAFPDTKPTLGS